jgi:hypothetical protein
MSGLSVLTLVKDRTAHLQRQVEGLCRGTTQPNELIIVNMGQQPLALPVANFPIKMIEHPSRGLPLAQARNLAASHAQFERFLFLDVDCIPMRRLLQEVDRYLEHFNGLLCAEIRYLASADCEEWQEEQLLLKARIHPVRKFPRCGLRVERNYGLFWSLAFAMRRAQFVYLGGFDERFTGYGAEDTEFAFRARDCSLELAFLGGTGAFHQYHEIFEPPLQYFDDIVRNAKLFYDIRGTWPMHGWLNAFQAMGLISLAPDRIEILRKPVEQEIAAALKHPSAVF